MSQLPNAFNIPTGLKDWAASLGVTTLPGQAGAVVSRTSIIYDCEDWVLANNQTQWTLFINNAPGLMKTNMQASGQFPQGQLFCLRGFAIRFTPGYNWNGQALGLQTPAALAFEGASPTNIGPYVAGVGINGGDWTNALANIPAVMRKARLVEYCRRIYELATFELIVNQRSIITVKGLDQIPQGGGFLPDTFVTQGGQALTAAAAALQVQNAVCNPLNGSPGFQNIYTLSDYFPIAPVQPFQVRVTIPQPMDWLLAGVGPFEGLTGANIAPLVAGHFRVSLRGELGEATS